ncbi:Protein disulfide isomerase [Entamoeba marina]
MFITFIVLLITFITPSFAHFFGDAPIFTPTQKDFASLERSTSATIVMFYAPWCGHCKKLAPEYAAAAKEINGKVIFAAVNCEEEQELCGRYEIRGYPTVKILNAQKGHDLRSTHDYNGPREKRALTNAAMSLIPDWVEKLPNNLQDGVVLFSNKEKRTMMYKAIAMHFASVFKFYDANESDEEFVKEYEIEEYPTLLVRKEGKSIVYDGPIEINSIIKFLNGLIPQQQTGKSSMSEDEIPYVNIIAKNDEMIEKQCNGKACLVFLVGEEYDQDILENVATSLKGRMHVLTISCVEQVDVCSTLNVLFDTPTAAVFVPKKGKLVPFVGGFNHDELVSFASSVLNGRASRVQNMKTFPSLIDRITNPYVAPVIEEDEF